MLQMAGEKMNNTKKKGISHRLVHYWLVLVILIFSGTVVYTTLRLTDTFWDITNASRQNTKLQKAAHELMNASDYLTEMAQRFTVDGDIRFLHQYFVEAFESKRREEAIAKMDVDEKTDVARKKLQVALDNSVELMDIEYYAMKLVTEAKGYSDYPEVLASVELDADDMAKSPQEKLKYATELIHSDEYYAQKDKIRSSMQDSLDEVDKMTKGIEEEELNSLRREICVVRIAVIIQASFIFFLIWLTTRLSINPVLDAVEQIKANNPISEGGSNEFRYLAKAYNKMYEKNKSSIESLSYKAFHDELTGAYNRAGYEFLLSNIELETTYMMLFDVDDFKNFNDLYGHETGDRVLKKIVSALNNALDNDDCICRIGGDEFVVFVMHSDAVQRNQLEKMIKQIENELENTDDGLPPIYISIGIMDGKDARDKAHLFEMADLAMYESKKQGKGTYTFY